MKINKAIERLNDFIIQDPDPDFQDIADAIMLGIEALKRITKARDLGGIPAHNLLPGETARNGQNFPEETLSKLRESPLGREPRQ